MFVVEPDEHGGELDDGRVEEPPVRGRRLLSRSVPRSRRVELQLVLVTLSKELNCLCLQFSWCLERNVLLSCYR